MSDTLSPADALAVIPGWDAASVSWRELEGGLTNRNYAVERGGESFVLRLDAAHTTAFNLDRTAEIEILEAASAAGLAPELAFADPESGILLTRYVSGRTWSAADLDDDSTIEALADLLRRVHALPTSGIEFDPMAVARGYSANLHVRHELREFALRCEEVVATIPKIERFFCCHNDVVAANVIARPDLMLLDWEYACDNEPLFDLASLVGYHDLDRGRRSVLLSAYAGGKDPGLQERLELQVRLYDAIQWLWLANRQLITRSDSQAARLEELRRRIR
ncbi:MAG: choline/ethanolamine kinase family protein [Woeseia sp.]